MTPKLRRLGLALVAALALTLILMVAQRHRRTLYTATWFDLFDTVSVVKGYAASQADWDEQMDALHADLLYYHRLFDIYHHYDGMVNLYDVNIQAAAGPVSVADELYTFLDWCAHTVYPQTDGATNVAAGAVLALWHDARESEFPAPPEDSLIQAALAHMDITDLVLESGTVSFADPALRLDVGAVGKGYAVELAAEAAEARGLDSALLNIGGNLRAIGQKPDGPWTVGVENPWDSDPTYIQTLDLPDGGSLIVSGDYQRYFEYEGMRYSHLIDLTTGYPAQYCSSVAILAAADAGGMGDALSTALFCLPESDGRQLLDTQQSFAALWMYPDGSTSAGGNWPGQPVQ